MFFEAANIDIIPVKESGIRMSKQKKKCEDDLYYVNYVTLSGQWINT